METRKTENKKERILARLYKRYLYLRLPDELKFLEEPNKLLLESARKGSKAGIKYSLLIGANVNARSEYGHTALMEAANWGHTETAKLLIKKGANVNAEDNNGWTALIKAANWGHTETAKLLIKKGANVNAEDNNGWTALIWAAYDGRTETVELLIENGADVLYAYGDDVAKITINKLREEKPEIFTEKQGIMIDLYSNSRNIPPNKRKEVLKLLRESQKKGLITKEKSLKLFTNLQKEWNRNIDIISEAMKKPKDKSNKKGLRKVVQ